MRSGAGLRQVLVGGLVYIASLAVLIAVAAHAVWALVGALLAPAAGSRIAEETVAPNVATPVVSYRVAEDSFMDRIRSESFWRSKRSNRSTSGSSSSRPGAIEQPNRLGRRPNEETGNGPFDPWTFNFNEDGDRPEQTEERKPRRSNNYRTMCVRLCDGYYWPVSFATSRDRLAADARKCTESCGTPARLFVYRNPGEEVEEMQDLSGSPYAKLRTAFLYRTTFDAACRCRAEAWEQASLDRHRLYALQARKRKGDRSVGAELDELRRKVQDTRNEERRVSRKVRQSSAKGWMPISATALPPVPPRRTASSYALKPTNADTKPSSATLAVVTNATALPQSQAVVKSEAATATEPPVATLATLPATAPVNTTRRARKARREIDTSSRMSLGARPAPRQRVATAQTVTARAEWRRRIFKDD